VFVLRTRRTTTPSSNTTLLMNSIDALFQNLRAARRKAFMPFVTAGDPDLAFTRELIPAVAESGADLIEVGFPFSDPIADGPVIQASYTRALDKHLKLADIFATLGEIANRPGWKTPLVAMASYSLMFKKGPAAFIDTAKASGSSGAVVPDLPVEEAEELSKLAKEKDFKLILLVTPTTSPKRAEQVVKACSGFVYVVSVVGITGERDKLPTQLKEQLARLRTMTDLPLCVGFGVSKPEQVRELQKIADGVIVGSALVKKLEIAAMDRSAALVEVRKLVSELSGH
jgi:tryptophan synthase alpha chain